MEPVLRLFKIPKYYEQEKNYIEIVRMLRIIVKRALYEDICH